MEDGIALVRSGTSCAIAEWMEIFKMAAATARPPRVGDSTNTYVRRSNAPALIRARGHTARSTIDNSWMQQVQRHGKAATCGVVNMIFYRDVPFSDFHQLPTGVILRIETASESPYALASGFNPLVRRSSCGELSRMWGRCDAGHPFESHGLARISMAAHSSVSLMSRKPSKGNRAELRTRWTIGYVDRGPLVLLTDDGRAPSDDSPQAGRALSCSYVSEFSAPSTCAQIWAAHTR